MKNIYKALADFQHEVPIIHKGTQGYGYSYANLSEIFKVIMPLLKKHGLGFTQILEGDTLKTILFHIDSGEELVGNATIPQNVQLAKMNTYQVMGSAITYFRRYTLSSMLGLITDEDNDAAGEMIAPGTDDFISATPNKQVPSKKQMDKLLERAQKEGGAKILAEAEKHFKLDDKFRQALDNTTAF